MPATSLSQLAPYSEVPALARFFPAGVPVRLPVAVWATDAQGRAFVEHTTVEYATPLEVVFASAMPFAQGDQLRLTLRDGGLDVTMHVVACRAGHGKIAVAARVSDPSTTLPIRKVQGMGGIT